MSISQQIKEIADAKGTPLLIQLTGTKLLVPRHPRTIRRWIQSAIEGGQVQPALEKAVLDLQTSQETTDTE